MVYPVASAFLFLSSLLLWPLRVVSVYVFSPERITVFYLVRLVYLASDASMLIIGRWLFKTNQKKKLGVVRATDGGERSPRGACARPARVSG